MADEPASDTPPPPPRPSKPSKILPILMVLNLAGTGAVVYFQLKPRPAVVDHAQGEEKAHEDENKPGPVFALDPFIVNLNEEGSSRYLKATFEIEVVDIKAQKELELNKRAVRDGVLRYLSSLGVVDTLGDVGKSKIQAEVMARVDKSLGGGKVKHVFFTDFVVQ